MRAMEHIEKITLDIHPMGSLENEIVRDYILAELSELDLKAEMQKAYSSNLIWGKERSGNVENIYTILEGKGKDRDSILMMAHYDSTYGGPGAADDASGVASLLEIIRILKSSEPLQNDIVFLFTDGEEEGLLGATAFIKEMPLVDNIDLVINLEARGNTGPVIMFETADNNGWYMNEFRKAIKEPMAYSFSYEIYKRMSNDTDFTKFKEIGKSGFNYANIAGYETYHKEEDNAKNLNRGTLQHMGENALSLARHFGNLELDNRQSSNAVYFTVAKSILIVYSVNLAIPLTILTIALYVLSMCIGIKKKYISLKETLLGVVITIITIAIAFGTGLIGKTITGAIHMSSWQENWFTHNSIKNLITISSICLIASIAVILFIMSFIYWKLQMRLSIYSLIHGTLLIWLVITLVTGVWFQSASYIFVWPTIILLLGLTLLPGFKNRRVEDITKIIIFAMVTLSSVVIFIPLCYLLFLSMIMPGLIIIPILIAVSALPLLLIVQTGVIAYKWSFHESGR